MQEPAIKWTEEDSQTYQNLAVVAVPEREEQVATIVALLPYDRSSSFIVIELGPGEGYMSEVILECFPNATVRAFDGSEEMRRTAAARLSRFGERFSIEAFDIEDLDWLDMVDGADCAVSSLCVHHLHGPEKQRMFAGLAGKLNPGGALIIADLVEAGHPAALDYLAATWDHETRKRSVQHLGGDSGWRSFREEQWNIYRYPDEMDRPSRLSDQLVWLSDAGFIGVDCFWMKAGHAVYGGYLPGGDMPTEFVGFERSLEVAVKVLGTGGA